MSKHTPGPWQECGHARGGCSCGLVYSADFVVADVSPNSEEMGDLLPSIDARKANARLIAAAPDLYDLAAYAVDNPNFNSAEFDRMARAAIAKARGES